MGKVREEEILEQAMIETEKEIFGSAFGKEEMTLDETGDKSLEEMGEGLEGQHEPEDEDEDEDEDQNPEIDATADKDQDKPDSTTKDEKNPKVEEEVPVREGRVPAGRLREQTEKARAAESERDALKAELEATRTQSRKDLDAINTKFDGVLAAMRQQQPAPKSEPPKVDEPPDLFEDPKGFAEYMQKGYQTELQRRDAAIHELRVETSLQVAHARYGDAFTNAFESAKNLDKNMPENQEVLGKIMRSPNPGEALVQWHKRNEVLRQVGDDPVKFRESAIAAERERLMKDPEFRRQILVELRAEAETGDNGRPRTSTNLPPSLSRVPGGNSHLAGARDAMDDSDRAIFESEFRNG